MTGKKQKKSKTETGKEKKEKGVEKQDEPKEFSEEKIGQKHGEEIKKTGPKKFLEFEKSIPLYFVVVAVIAALFIGYAISVFFSLVKEVKLEEIRKQKPAEEQEKITAIFFFDDSCRVCDRTHSFLGILKQNNIGVDIVEVPLSSNDGKEIRRDFNIAQLPVLLIVKKSVSEKMQIATGEEKKSLGEALPIISTEQLGFFVVEEQGFDKKAHTVSLVETKCGEAQLVTADLFEDPYSPNTIKFKQEIIDARKRFDKNVAFNYNYLPTASEQLFPDIQEKATYLAERLMCTIGINFFNQFEEAFYTEYCDIDKNNSLDAGELLECGKTKTFPVPLPKEKVDELVAKAGILAEVMDICIDSRAKDYILVSKQKAELFYVTGTPTAVVNCKYKTHPKFLPEVLCFVKPDLEGCKKNQQ